MAHHVIEYDCICNSCQGKGLYIGLAERDGFAVVCHSCKGTGQQHNKIEYDDFDGRVPAGVKQVVQVNPGIVCGVGKNGQYNQQSFGGMSYEDWTAGKPFIPGMEMRAFTCPCWWYQSADYTKKPDWEECEWGTFSSCSHFPTKDQCWKRWDRENLVQINGVGK